jgi:F0F1-type ATP synthase membrane subunit b/b'
MKKPLFFVLLLVPALLLNASTGEEGGGHHVDWFGVLGKVFNSTLLFGGLALMLRKPLIQMLADRGAAVENDFREREKALADSAVRLDEIEQRLQKVAMDVERIKAGAESGGREELARLEAAGREEARRIIALSEEEIRLRVDAAVRSVRSRIADLAIERFREDFKKRLDNDLQQKIIERNIRDAGEIDEGK